LLAQPIRRACWRKRSQNVTVRTQYTAFLQERRNLPPPRRTKEKIQRGSSMRANNLRKNMWHISIPFCFRASESVATAVYRTRGRTMYLRMFKIFSIAHSVALIEHTTIQKEPRSIIHHMLPILIFVVPASRTQSRPNQQKYAELLRSAGDMGKKLNIQSSLLPVYNDIFYHGAVPRSWSCTLFNVYHVAKKNAGKTSC